MMYKDSESKEIDLDVESSQPFLNTIVYIIWTESSRVPTNSLPSTVTVLEEILLYIISL